MQRNGDEGHIQDLKSKCLKYIFGKDLKFYYESQKYLNSQKATTKNTQFRVYLNLKYGNFNAQMHLNVSFKDRRLNISFFLCMKVKKKDGNSFFSFN